MSYSREFLIKQFKKGIRAYLPIASAAETMINYKLGQLDEDDWARIEEFFNSFKFPLHVYRGLKVTSEKDVNFKNPGNNWTVDNTLFHSSLSAFRNSNYILEGYIDEDQIDWPETVQNFMYYSVNAANNYRYPENEVTLKKGEVPHNLTGSMKECLTEDVNVPDKPSAQDKFRYYWELESRAIKQPQDLLRKFKNKFPNQYNIWGELFEWMLEHNEESVVEPQNFALYLEYDLDMNWGYIALVEFKTRYQESLNEATIDITTRLNSILDKIDPSKFTQDDYEAAIYDEVANELRPAGYNDDAIQKVVDTYIAQKQERLDKLDNLSKAKELLKDYVTTSFGVSSYYIDEDGIIYDLGNSGYGHAQVAKLLDDNGLELDYEVGKASKLLRSNGWIRLNTNLNFVELPDTKITSAQENSILLALDSMHNNIKVGDSIQVTGKDSFKVYRDCTSEHILNRIKRYYTTGKLYESKDLVEVYPQKNETKSDFINRFMRVTAKEYPDVKQRYAVANSYWDRRDLKETYLDPEEKFWDYRTKEVSPGQYIDTTRNEIRWVDDMLEDPAYYEKKGYTARIVEITPEEYFKHCAELFGNSVEAQKKQIAADTGVIQNLTQVIKKYHKRFPIPFINIKDRTQEGRHRMYVLGELFGWDKKVPVLIIQDVNNVRVPGKVIK